MQPFLNNGCHLGFCQKSKYQPFKEIQGLNSEFKLLPPNLLMNLIDAIVPIVDFCELGLGPKIHFLPLVCLFLCPTIYQLAHQSISLPVCVSVCQCACIFTCLSIFIPFGVSVYISVYLLVYLSTSLHICLSFSLSASLFTCLYVCLSVCTIFCLSISEFLHLFIKFY